MGEGRGLVFSEGWLKMCSIQSSSTRSGLWRELRQRYLIRYFVALKLKGVQTGQVWDHIHMLLGCPAIRSYRQEVTKAIQNIFGDGIDSSFTTIYLGNSEAHILAEDKYLLKTDILAASKKAATQTWLQNEPPTKTDWVDAVSTIQGI